jgi:hypothetical protein
VQKCDEENVRKLERVMNYLRKRVKVLVDTAHSVNYNSKSHTGVCVVIGDVGAVHCNSEKQKIVTMSSTEAELMTLSDLCNQGLHVSRFLQAQGCRTDAAMVFQDNSSCIAMVARGRSAAERSRQIDIRCFWVKECVDGEVMIEHLEAERMYTNVLFKSLWGGQLDR